MNTSWRSIDEVLTTTNLKRYLEDVLTFLQGVMKTSRKQFEDVFWSRMTKENIFVLIKKCSSRRMFAETELKQFNCYTKKWVCISGFLAYRKFWRSTVFKTTHFSFSIVIILNIVTSSSNCFCHQNDNEFLREHMRECCLCKNWLYSKKEKGVRYLSSVTQFTNTPPYPPPPPQKKNKAKQKTNPKQTNKQTIKK